MSQIQVYKRKEKAPRFQQGNGTKEFQDSLFRQPVQTVQIDLKDNTLWFGSDNAFPLKLATLVQESPAASVCISILSDFLEGAGFSDKNLEDKIVNGQGQRFADIHSLVCESYALFEGFTILVKYTIDGRISEIFSVPFENVRLQKPDDKGIISKVTVNPYYGTGIWRKADNVEYDTFNPDPKVVLAQMAKADIDKGKSKYKGQILYVAFTRPLSRFYPQPYYYSAKSWMAIDAGIGEYHENNLDAGFFQTVLLKMVGNPDEPSTHPDDQTKNTDGNLTSIRTRGERFNIMMQDFVGAESKTKMMVLWETVKDTFPELQAFPAPVNADFFTALRTMTDEKILQATKTPSILCNMTKDNALSDGNQMANATKVMHDRVAKPQNMLERTYKRLLDNFKEPFTGEIKIKNSNSFDSMAKIDPLAWAALTLEEQREWLKENSDYPIKDANAGPTPAPSPAPSQTNPIAQTPSNEFTNVFFTDYPQGAKDVAKRALKYVEDNPGCGTPMGKRMGQDIVEGKPIAFKDLKRIYNFLKANRPYKDMLFTDSCESCKFAMWGGMAMFDYCAAKIKMINE